jgi:hypothetical protein
MGSFTITQNGPLGRATYTLSSSNGSVSGTPQQANLAVGAPFSMTQTALPQSGVTPNISSVQIAYSNPGGGGSFDLILKKNVSGDTLAQCTFDLAEVNVASQPYNWNLSAASTVASQDFYIGKGAPGNVIQLNLTVYFSNATIEATYFLVNIQAPVIQNINFTYPSAANNQFAFGPYQFSHKVGTNTVYDFTRLDWGDPNYITGQSNISYAIGDASGGLAPWQISFQGNNTTSSDGVFYMLQKVNKATSAFQFHSNSTNEDAFGYSSTPGYGLDNFPGNPGSYPWAYAGVVTNALAGSGLQAVPPPNSWIDPNGVGQSYYGDNPQNSLKDISLRKLVPTNFITSFYFTTYFTFQATGGIPIYIYFINWNLYSSHDNPTARSSLDWFKAVSTKSNWVGSDATYNVGSVISGPGYISWNFIAQDFTAGDNAAFIPHEIGVSPSWLTNIGPMSGGIPLYPVYGKSLPKPFITGANAPNIGPFN